MSESTNRKDSLKKHEIKCHLKNDEVKDFSCDLCVVKCSNKFNLKIHMGRKHQLKTVVENNIGFFKLADEQKPIKQVLTNEFTCEECGKNYKNKFNLTRHKNTVHGPGIKDKKPRNR